MKKLFLFFAASALIISAVAQKPVINKTPVLARIANNHFLDNGVNESNAPLLPLGAKTASAVYVGNSYNAYSIMGAFQKQLSYNETFNALGFAHRGGLTKLEGDKIYFNTSFDGGATWDSTNLVFAKSHIWGRYPQGAFYNPAGNTDINNLYSLVVGSAVDSVVGTWGATYIGWKKKSGTPKNVLINHGNTDRLDNQSLQVCNDGKFYFCGDANKRNSSDDIIQFNYELISGQIDATNDTVINVTTTVLHPPFARFGTDTVDKTTGSSAVAFNKDGSVGYYVFIGVRGDIPNPENYVSNRPIVYKTTDHGASWNLQPDFRFDSIPVFQEIFGGNGVWQDTNLVRPYFSIDDVAVDGNDNLHIFSYVYNHSTTNTDSTNYIWTYASIEGIMFDTFTTSDGWDAAYLDMQNTKDFSIGTTANPMYIRGRLQAALTNDGKTIFYSWADSDPTLVASDGNANKIPDLYIASRNLDSASIEGKINVTAGTAFEYGAKFHMMAPQVKQEGNSYRIFATVTQLGSTPYNDAVSYYFLKDIITSVNINNIDKSIGNVSNIYPNPSNGISYIDLSLTKSNNVSINVVNLMGQVVSSENLGTKSMGMHKLAIDATNLTSGIYFVTVKAGNSTSTSKMIVR